MGNSTLNSSLSAAIHLYRKTKRLSAEECAKELGVSKTALLNIERQQANPTLETVDIIARNMGADPLSLLGDPGASQLLTSIFLMNLLENGSHFSLDTLQRAAYHLTAALQILDEACSTFREEDANRHQ